MAESYDIRITPAHTVEEALELANTRNMPNVMIFSADSKNGNQLFIDGNIETFMTWEEVRDRLITTLYLVSNPSSVTLPSDEDFDA